MWLSRLIVTAGLLVLSACSSFEIKSLGQALYEQDAVIEVVQASNRKARLYSRQLRTRLALDSTAATHSVSTTLGVSSSSTLSVQGSSSIEEEDDDGIDPPGRSGEWQSGVVGYAVRKRDARHGIVSIRADNVRPPGRRAARRASCRPRRRRASPVFQPDRFL